MADWLYVLAIISLITAGLCSFLIAIDVFRRPQKMWIMNLVWPITALYSGPLGLTAYVKIGRSNAKEADSNRRSNRPFWQFVAVGATHCGSGCALGDIVAEWITFSVPIVAFGRAIFGTWLLDYAFAYVFGIAFQYFSIQPMKNLPPAQGLWAAIRADTLSLSAWQVGMYGWMAIAIFAIFRHEIPKTNPVFWFLMQIAMLSGFLTSCPTNWWLIRKGWKEAM